MLAFMHILNLQQFLSLKNNNYNTKCTVCDSAFSYLLLDFYPNVRRVLTLYACSGNTANLKCFRFIEAWRVRVEKS